MAMKIKLVYKGGSGSGNYGHEGRPGLVGGSLPGNGNGDYGEHTSGVTTGKEIKQISKEAANENYPYDNVGIRVQESTYGLKVGDRMEHQSSVWEDGEKTVDLLNGVSAISIRGASYMSDSSGYSGDYVLILGSDRAEGGYDPEETVMYNPTILDIKYLISNK